MWNIKCHKYIIFLSVEYFKTKNKMIWRIKMGLLTTITTLKIIHDTQQTLNSLWVNYVQFGRIQSFLSFIKIIKQDLKTHCTFYMKLFCFYVIRSWILFLIKLTSVKEIKCWSFFSNPFLIVYFYAIGWQ